MQRLVWKMPRGKYSLHKESNSNGELMYKYVAANNMCIMSTKFKHTKKNTQRNVGCTRWKHM